MAIRKPFRALVALLALLPAGAFVAPKVVAQEAAAASGPFAPSEAELRAFFDAVVPPLLAEHRVPGVVVAVVAEGETRLATGYGLAELDPERPADAGTPFATGSVAKLFTWTAVMQQVERGELDLDTDVNAYLDFEIPATFDEPITLRHLLTHTPGFEDRPLIGLFSRDADGLSELGVALDAYRPARLWAPGVESAYSNYGTALAGYVVERVSGVPFERYVETEILGPLGMTRSSFRQPLPAELTEIAAVGYAPAGEAGFVAPGHEYVELAPAGGMVMSAADAARFLRAHLQGGVLDGARILRRGTVAQMHTTLFRPDPSLPGNAYGFWESARHGERILQHGGDTMLFHTQLALLPERNAGVYLATNAPGGTFVRDALWEAFLDRFFPAPGPTAADAGTTARYEGLYGANRVATTTAGKIASLFQSVRVDGDDDVLVTNAFGVEHRWLPQGDGVFADVDREGELALFRPAADGRPALYVSEAPMMVFRELRWFETPGFHGGLLIAAAALLLSGLIGFPLAAWLARRGGDAKDVGARRTRWLGTVAALLPLVFVALFVGAMADPMGPAFGVSPLMAVSLAVGIAAALAVGLFALLMVIAWLLGWWRTPARVHATLVALAGLALVWQMNYWNLLGFRI